MTGYELLYRQFCQPKAEEGAVTDDQSASSLMINTVVDLGIESVSAHCPVHINISRDYAEGRLAIPFKADQAFFCINYLDCLDEAVLNNLQSLSSEQGFRLICDQYDAERSVPQWLENFDYVKCNSQFVSVEQFSKLATELKKKNIGLIATHVEDVKQVEQLIDAGVDGLQGFFFSKPDMQKFETVSTSMLPVIRLLAKILNPLTELEELEQLIVADVSLTYRVLRLVKSARYGMKHIDSVSQAIVYLGRDTLKQLLLMLVLTGKDDGPTELARVALVRAKMCELMASNIASENASHYFLLGLVSVLDALLDMPMHQVCQHLPLEKSLENALTVRAGFEGQLLQCVIEFEECREYAINQPYIGQAELNDYYLQALSWADDIFATMTL